MHELDKCLAKDINNIASYDDYTAKVMYIRSLNCGDADQIAEKYPDTPVREALKRQLAHELQVAADDVGVAGNYMVVEILFHDEPGFKEAEAQAYPPSKPFDFRVYNN